MAPIDDPRFELVRLFLEARNLFTQGEHDLARELGKQAEVLLEEILEGRGSMRIPLVGKDGRGRQVYSPPGRPRSLKEMNHGSNVTPSRA